MHVDDGVTIPVPTKLVILQQIVSGMEALTDQKLIHRDLALRNVLVFALDVDGVASTSVKVADFGITVNSHTAGHNSVQGGPLPIRWLAPDALRRGKYSEKTDVWACQAWGGSPSGSHRSPDQPFPDPLWDVITPCWTPLAKDRPTFARLGIELSAGMTVAVAAAADGRVADLEDTLERQTRCEVCMDQLKDRVIRPCNCNHLCVCGDYSAMLFAGPPIRRICPMCRTNTASAERVYQ